MTGPGLPRGSSRGAEISARPDGAFRDSETLAATSSRYCRRASREPLEDTRYANDLCWLVVGDRGALEGLGDWYAAGWNRGRLPRYMGESLGDCFGEAWLG